VAAFRTEGVAVPQSLTPVLDTLRAHHLGYAYASYWIAWRITFESQLHVVGAKSSYAHPFVRAGRVHPGDPPNDLGIDPTYYREAERHRDAAHVFVLGGDVEPRVAPVLRKARYTRVVSGDFSVWLPPGA
jgi:hypothetical protein